MAEKLRKKRYTRRLPLFSYYAFDFFPLSVKLAIPTHTYNLGRNKVAKKAERKRYMRGLSQRLAMLKAISSDFCQEFFFGGGAERMRHQKKEKTVLFYNT